MSKIGYVVEKVPGELFEGEINTLALSIRFTLERQPRGPNPSAPDFDIRAWNTDGAEVNIGSAWEKKMTKPGRQGEIFLSLTFSDPAFTKPLNVAAFRNGDDQRWVISYRPRPEKPRQ